MAAQKQTITGTRDLSRAEIELINEVLAAEQAFLDVQRKVVARLASMHESKKSAAQRIFRSHDLNHEKHELDRFQASEPFSWAERGRKSIQMGTMALVRAIQQPKA